MEGVRDSVYSLAQRPVIENCKLDATSQLRSHGEYIAYLAPVLHSYFILLFAK